MRRPPSFTKRKQKRFLEALSQTANVTDACRRCEIARSGAYLWRDENPDFAAAWEEAIERGIDALEDEATRRAHEGRLEPVFYQGVECGQVRKFSDGLLMFLLRARRPERFKERQSLEHAGEMTLRAVLDEIDGKSRGLPSRR